MELKDHRILITRPAGRADDLCAAIVDRCGIAVHIPLLGVAALDPLGDAAIWAKTNAQIAALTQYRRVIAISVNAVHYGLQWLRAQHDLSALPSTINWYGIGAATIAEFAQAGIRASGGSSAMSSEALLALPELQSVADENILILRGIGGRETLAGVLRSRGAHVEYAECYRRVAPQLDREQNAQLQHESFTAVCVNSSETLQNMAQLLETRAKARLHRTPLIVPSARVADDARALEFSCVIVAANASTAATLEALDALDIKQD